MEGLDINFRERFYKKHGEKIFKDIVKQIEGEYNSNCDINYIDIIFTVAFISYFGVTDTSKIRLLGGISKDRYIDINQIQKTHKKSILQIQEYIQETNRKNLGNH